MQSIPVVGVSLPLGSTYFPHLLLLFVLFLYNRGQYIEQDKVDESNDNIQFLSTGLHPEEDNI